MSWRSGVAVRREGVARAKGEAADCRDFSGADNREAEVDSREARELLKCGEGVDCRGAVAS